MKTEEESSKEFRAFETAKIIPKLIVGLAKHDGEGKNCNYTIQNVLGHILVE